jgi:two-component system chemotaxis response regulator CheB
VVRIVIAEDSPTVMDLLVAAIQADSDLEVVGQARNGLEAVRLVKRLRPDVVAMDILMPEMDGFDATKQIMIEAPTPIVLVTGNMDVGEAEASMHALRVGALHVLQKPSGPTSATFDRDVRELRQVLKAMAEVSVVHHWGPEKMRPLPSRRPMPPSPPRGDAPGTAPLQVPRSIVAIAVSTGGPAALQAILSPLPANLPATLLVVQHISQGFVHSLARSMNLVTSLRVRVAEDGERLATGTVYLAPDGYHMGVDAQSIALSSAPPIGGFKPSGTHLFRSVARTFGSKVLALILTGMGEDGVAGLEEVQREGGLVIAQNEETSIVYGMPRAAVERGFAHEVLPIEQVAARIQEVIGHDR